MLSVAISDVNPVWLVEVAFREQLVDESLCFCPVEVSVSEVCDDRLSGFRIVSALNPLFEAVERLGQTYFVRSDGSIDDDGALRSRLETIVQDVP